MSDANSADLAAVELSPKLTYLIAAIGDQQLQQQITTASRHCLVTLRDIGRLHLPQDQFEDSPTEDQHEGAHLDLAPYVLSSLASINALLSYLMATFPPPARAEIDDMDDFDMEFDLIDGPDGQGGLSGDRAEAKQMTPAETVADAAHAFAFMLRGRVVQFGERLRSAVNSDDSWRLLAVLDDFKHRLSKAVQGLLFGILAGFSGDAKREEILPEYRSAVSDSVSLCSAIYDLSFHIAQFNSSLSDPDIAAPLLFGVSDRLARFCSRPVYRTLRAEDKKAVIDFRRELYDLRHGKEVLTEGVPMTRLRRTVEGFSKFLEGMQQINNREVLVLHDKKALSQALEQLDAVMALANEDEAQARQIMEGMIESLSSVTGRSEQIDAAVAEYRGDGEKRSLPAELRRFMPLLQTSLGSLK